MNSARRTLYPAAAPAWMVGGPRRRILDLGSGAGAFAQTLVDEGHEVGDHLMHDEPSIRLSRNRFREDLSEARDLLAPYQEVSWWRPGSGWTTRTMVREAHALGMRCVLGTVAVADGPPPEPGSWREQRLLGQISAGAVVVLHEGTDERRPVVDTLDWLLTRLAERGLRSVTLTELSRL